MPRHLYTVYYLKRIYELKIDIGIIRDKYKYRNVIHKLDPELDLTFVYINSIDSFMCNIIGKFAKIQMLRITILIFETHNNTTYSYIKFFEQHLISYNLYIINI